MADRTTYQIKTPKSDVQLLTAAYQGNAGADMVNLEAGNMGGGEISSAVRQSTGVFVLTFRKKYAQLKCVGEPGIVGTTLGLDARFTAFDVVNQTATVIFEVGVTPTDPAATDFVYFSWFVRNSGFNK